MYIHKPTTNQSFKSFFALMAAVCLSMNGISASAQSGLKPPRPSSAGAANKPGDSKEKIELKPGQELVDPCSEGNRVPPSKQKISLNFPKGAPVRDVIALVAGFTCKPFVIAKGLSGNIIILSKKEVTRQEAWQLFITALASNNLTVREAGFAYVVERKSTTSKASSTVLYGKNWTLPTDRVITQIIPLDYAPAKDVHKEIRSFLRTRNVTVFNTINAISITGSGYDIKRALAVIKHLDRRGGALQLHIHKLEHRDPKDIFSILQKVYKPRSTNSYLSSAIADSKINSVILVGPSRDNLNEIVKFIKTLDVGTATSVGSGKQIRVRALDYARAEELAKTLQSLVAGGKTNTRSRSSIIRRPTPVSRLGSRNSRTSSAAPTTADLGDIKVTADKSTNSLIIQATRTAYNQLDKIIRKLDKKKAQVFLEVDVLEINTDKNFNLSTSSILGATAGNEKVIMPFGWAPDRAAPFAIQSNDTNAASLAQGLAGTNGIFGVIANSPITIANGITLSPSAFLFALKSNGNTNNLSSPNVLVSNNEKAEITSKDTVYFEGTNVDRNGNSTTSATQNKIDTELGLVIQPQISPSRTVNLDVSVKVSDFVRSATDNPGTVTRDVKTKVTVDNKQTVVLGGLKKVTDGESNSRVPLLGDIPIIGALFRSVSENKTRRTVNIFIRPYIIESSDDLTEIYRDKINAQREFLTKIYGVEYKEEHDIFNETPDEERVKEYEEFREKRPISSIEADGVPLDNDAAVELSSPEDNPSNALPLEYDATPKPVRPPPARKVNPPPAGRRPSPPPRSGGGSSGDGGVPPPTDRLNDGFNDDGGDFQDDGFAPEGQ